MRPNASFQLGTEIASTSGTSITFTGIPAGTKRVMISFVGVSTNGTSAIMVQIGDSGGIEDATYTSTIVTLTNAAAVATVSGTTGFLAAAPSAGTNAFSGIVTLILEDSSDFTWVATAVGKSTTLVMQLGAGDKALSAELTQVRITMFNGSDTFDAGEINISFE